MKTAVTAIIPVQVGIDNWKDLKITKVFDDSATLLDIKKWAKTKIKNNENVENISLGCLDFSDVYDEKE